MGEAAPVAAFVASFVLVVLAAFGLRARGVLTTAHAPVVSILLTEFSLPALIFERVSRAPINLHDADATAIILVTELVSVVATYVIGQRYLRLPGGSLGSFVVASSFASTSQLGLVMINALFGQMPDIQAMAAIVTQFAVGLPVNTVGVWIMLHTSGAARERGRSLTRTVLTTSPVLALMIALAWNLLGLPTGGPVMSAVNAALGMTGAALPVLAALVVGLTAGRFPVRRFAPALACSLLAQLVLQPMLGFLLMPLFPLSPVERMVTALYAALPATPLAVAFATRYGGDRELASALVLSSAIVSIVTLPLTGLLL